MKYFILVPDGAADEPIAALDGKTPLEYAKMDNINKLAVSAEIGEVLTVPKGIPVGSDAANLSILGYDPSQFLTGRAAFEAASVGLDVKLDDIVFRAGIVTLFEPDNKRPADASSIAPYEKLIMHDHTAGEISTEEAELLIAELCEFFNENKNRAIKEKITFYSGIKYKALMIIEGGQEILKLEFAGPHDIRNQNTGSHKPKPKVDNNGNFSVYAAETSMANTLWKIQKNAYEIMRKSKVNEKRVREGKNPGNAIWLWGCGIKPELPKFYAKYGLHGSVISAVDLIKGIGGLAGLENIYVEGANGTLNTNYKGKAEAAIAAFEKGKDLVFLHIEAPDECGHQADIYGKVKSLEFIDELVVKPIASYLGSMGEDYKILIVPDHKTPAESRVHKEGAVPYMIYDSKSGSKMGASEKHSSNSGIYSESENIFTERSKKNGKYFENGYELLNYFLGDNFE